MKTLTTRTIEDSGAFGTALDDACAAGRYREADAALQREYDAFIERARKLVAKRRRGKREDDEVMRDCFALIAEACSGGYLEYSAEDVEGWYRHAHQIGGRVPRIGYKTIKALRDVRLVPNAPFRERFLELERWGEKGLLHAIACATGRPTDTSYAKRVLGLAAQNGCVRIFIDVNIAERLCEPLRLHPYECGV